MQAKTEIIDTYLHGKIPPQARELEQAVLGALLIEKEAILDVCDILRPEVFYVDAHALIYAAMNTLLVQSNPIDLLTITDTLRRAGKLEEIGGAYYLSELTNKVASSANVIYHSQIVVQQFIKRELIRIGNKTISQAYDDTTDPFELLEAHENLISNIINFRNSRKIQKLFDVSKRVMIESENIRGQNIEYLGVPSGYHEVDRITGGWRNTDLIIVAARPAMGKTAFACGIATNAAEQGYPVGFVTLEMPATQIASRVISIRVRINLMKLRNAKYTDAEYSSISDAVDHMEDIPLFIDDSSGVSLVQLKAIIRKLVNKYGCKLILVDQLNHINHSEKNRSRNDEVGTITRTLKAEAKELDIPIILFHQLNREVESRGGDKKPQLSDLRDSGNVEQDADIVIFLHRPEYYKPNNPELVGLAEVIFSKHRNGVVGSVPLGYRKEFTMFHNISEMEKYEIKSSPTAAIGKGATDDDLPF